MVEPQRAVVKYIALSIWVFFHNNRLIVFVIPLATVLQLHDLHFPILHWQYNLYRAALKLVSQTNHIFIATVLALCSLYLARSFMQTCRKYGSHFAKNNYNM